MANLKSFPHYEINVKDESLRNVLAVDELSLHRPLYFGFAEKGPANIPIYGSYDELVSIFGEEMFNEYGKYFNHPTVFLKENIKYQKVFFSRMVPDDAKAASMVLEAAIYEDQIQQWEKDQNGNRVVDSNGNWIPKDDGGSPPTLIKEPGIVIEWRRRALDDNENMNSIQVTTVTENGKTKTVYPIFVYKEKYAGEYGNNTGIKIWKDDDTSDLLITDIGAMIYRFGLEQKLSDTSSIPIQTKFSEDYIEFTPKPFTIDPNTGDKLGYDEVINEKYSSLPVYTKIYNENIKTIGDICIPYEDANIFNIPNGWMVNIIDGIDISGNYYDHIVVNSNDAYQSYLFDTIFYLPNDVIANDNVNPGSNIGINQYLQLDTPLNPNDNKSPLNEFVVSYLMGGYDGTLTLDVLEEKVRQFLNYTSPSYPDIIDKARYPITHIYDTGYSYNHGTKDALINFASLRNDIKIILATQDASEKPNTMNEDQIIGLDLVNKAKLHPESFLFGTQACRFTVYAQCGVLVNNIKYKNVVPATIDAMIKKAYWQGATYVKGEPKGLPKSKVTILKNINYVIPVDKIKETFFDFGINCMQYYDMTSCHYPMVKTVYGNDTSLLSDDIFVDYIVYIGSIVQLLWAKYVGTSYNINTLYGNIINDLNKSIYKALGSYIRAEVTTYQTAEDAALGYQITVQIAVYDTPANKVWKVIVPVRRDAV